MSNYASLNLAIMAKKGKKEIHKFADTTHFCSSNQAESVHAGVTVKSIALNSFYISVEHLCFVHSFVTNPVTEMLKRLKMNLMKKEEWSQSKGHLQL